MSFELDSYEVEGVPYPEWEAGLAAKYEGNLNIASLTHPNGIRALSLISDVTRPAAGELAYFLATYSRSNRSVEDIIREVVEVGRIDPNARIENIANKYGHASVMDMAVVAIGVEDIPRWNVDAAFYRTVVGAGQARSTRYQNFSEPRFMRLPRNLEIHDAVRSEFDSIMMRQFACYGDVLSSTYDILQRAWNVNIANTKHAESLVARNLDVARHFLPMGMLSSFGLVASARHWSVQIGQMRAGNSYVDRVVANMIYSLMVGNPSLAEAGYLREAPGLIRHSEPARNSLDANSHILSAIRGLKGQGFDQLNARENTEEYQIGHDLTPDETVLSHYILLEHPHISHTALRELLRNLPPNFIRNSVGEAWAKNHNRFYEVGPLGQSGTVRIDGYADLGTITDFLRHRSLERVIPLMHQEADFHAELFNRGVPLYKLCRYAEELPGMEDSLQMMHDMMGETYNRIKRWYLMAAGACGKEFADAYVRYLLPMGHQTRYLMYGSLADLHYFTDQRVREGGHINYRYATSDLADGLRKYESLAPSMENLPRPDSLSAVQAMGRS